MNNREQANALQCVRQPDGTIEIEGHYPLIGPYDTMMEAKDDLQGLKRFFRQEAVEDEDLDLLADILN